MADQDFVGETQTVPSVLPGQIKTSKNIIDNSLKDPHAEQTVYGQMQFRAFDRHKANTTALIVPSNPENNSGLQVEIDPTNRFDIEALYLEASEIAGQRLTAGQQLVMAMANQMGYEDLHPMTKAKVDQVRNSPGSRLDIQRTAAKLLNQYRQQIQTA